MYVRKEAVLASMIEGTQSSLSDLLLFELDIEPGVPLDDVREVSNYVAALDHGLKRLSGGFPLSIRLIKEMHGVLLAKGRGSDQTPGKFEEPKTGSAAPAPAMPPLFHRRLKRCRRAWENLSCFCMIGRNPPLHCLKPQWPMSSLKPSIRSLTATAVWAACCACNGL